MPRPKVPADQRQRAAEACNICRETKKRCSGTAPCTQCQRRGVERQCFITYAPRGSRTRARTEAARRSAASTTTSWPQEMPSLINPANETHRPSSVAEANQFQLVSPSESQRDDEDDSRNLSTCVEGSSTNNPPRMLLNLRGERMYIGGAASISFLQVIRSLVAEQIGPSPFSHNDKSDTMLESESPQAVIAPEPDTGVVGLNAEQKQQYLQCYYSVTEAFLHIFDTVELQSLVMSSGEGETSSHYNGLPPLRRAAIALVIAIGAQCESPSSANAVGKAYFRKAQSFAFAGFLEDPSLDLVRAFLLMAFYMLGECRRNAAFMYLGIAVRAALALGLHCRDSYAENPGQADQLRLRVWMSVCILDKLVNSILGRPAATAGIQLTDKKALVDLAEPGDDSAACLAAAYKVLFIINDITSKLYDKKEISISVVEKFLEDIESWKRELPQPVRSPQVGEQSGPHSFPTQNGAIGKVHVSCLYYFAVTLVTRPFLLSTLAAHPGSGAQHPHLVAACLDAAMYLAQTCAEAYNAGLLQGNMCIMKALVFAAGLVLGFESFAKNSVDNEIETAFYGARDVLRFLSTQSPQAAHYLEILTSLSNAIARRRSRESSAGRSRYVSKIFTLNPASDVGGLTFDAEAPWVHDLLTGPQTVHEGGEPDLAGWSFPQPDTVDLCLDWDCLNISQWDSFPFLS